MRRSNSFPGRMPGTENLGEVSREVSLRKCPEVSREVSGHFKMLIILKNKCPDKEVSRKKSGHFKSLILFIKKSVPVSRLSYINIIAAMRRHLILSFLGLGMDSFLVEKKAIGNVAENV